MITDVKIGKPVVAVVRKNCWEVDIEQISGDADAYEHGGSFFNDSDNHKMMAYVSLALAISDAQEDGYGTDVGSVFARIKDRFPDSRDEISEITGYDVTNDGQTLAMVTCVDVFWYDENGIKHYCTIVR